MQNRQDAQRKSCRATPIIMQEIFPTMENYGFARSHWLMNPSVVVIENHLY